VDRVERRRKRRRRVGRRRLVSLAAVSLAAWGAVTAMSSSHARPPQPYVPTAHRPIAVEPARPPQFVVVSFDGSGGERLWPYWRWIARRAHARFTFFVSGVYLLDWARHDLYRPPRHPPGRSDIGFAPASAFVRGMLRQMTVAYREGHEIGTHFNGHFCEPYRGNVDGWTAADWGRELDQFDRLVFHASANDGLRPPVRLPFGPREVVGDRTPCLQGRLPVLYRVLARRGFRYDASRVAMLGDWPRRVEGIWSVPLVEIPFVGHTYRVIAMDYNVFVNQTYAHEAPLADARALGDELYRSLWNAFLVSYRGNRAPLPVGFHFETWNHWAYDHALARFLLRACGLPDVRCASYRELVDWLDTHRLNR
jgi:hypothetical protein